MASDAPSNRESDDQWLSAAEVYGLATTSMPDGQARVAICTRAHSGLLRTRAERFEKHKEVIDNADLPREFWWARGHQALDQNWITGDFETWIDRQYHWKAFGVQFHRADLLKMLPQVQRALGDWISSAEALDQIADESRSLESAAQLLMDCAKIGAMKSVVGVYQLADEEGPLATEKGKALGPEEWLRFDDVDISGWRQGSLSTSYWDSLQRETVTIRLSGLRFARSDVERLKASLTEHLAPATKSPARRRHAGRPRNDWWDDLLIAMFKRLWEGKWTPSTQAELVEAMEHWLLDNPGDPANPRKAGDTALKERAKKLFTLLELGR